MNNHYCFKFYLNAQHRFEIDGLIGETHPHTWEIILNFNIRNGSVLKFDTIEKIIEAYFVKYQGRVLNEVAPFNVINPSMENIGQVVFEQLTKYPLLNMLLLSHIIISENPTRSYIIAEHVNLGALVMKSFKENETHGDKSSGCGSCLRNLGNVQHGLLGLGQ